MRAQKRRKLTSFCSILFCVLFSLVVFHDTGHAQISITPGTGLAQVVEPGSGAPITFGPTALNDAVVVYSFQVKDVDPLSDDGSGVDITCFHLMNLGTATASDIVEIVVLKGNGEAVHTASVNPVAPSNVAATSDCPAGAPAGGAVAFEAFIIPDPSPFSIVDDGTETFQIAVRTAKTDVLGAGSQNHTLILNVMLQFDEDVGSPPVTTTFTDSTTDSETDLIFNGGINELEEQGFAGNTIRLGATGVVARVKICDDDANSNILSLTNVNISQGTLGNALHSDISLFRMVKVSGTPTPIGTGAPTTDFNPGSSGFNLAIAFDFTTTQCEIFELEVDIAPSAQRGRKLHVRLIFSQDEPTGTPVDPSVNPGIQISAVIFIGSGIIGIPDISIAGSVVPLEAKSFPPPGIGSLEVQTTAIQFDPSVVHVEDFKPMAPYQLKDLIVDNRLGLLRFSLRIDPAQTPSAKTEGVLAYIELSVQGTAGERSPFVLQFDKVTDAAGVDVTPGVVAVSGSVLILSPGDIDSDNVPTVKDALLLANAILSCITTNTVDGLNNEQKKAADVAAPFAETGEVPTCDELTSADVRGIAHLAITLGIDMGITASRAAQATGVGKPKPWWRRWLVGLLHAFSPAQPARLSLQAPSDHHWTLELDTPVKVGALQGRVSFDPHTIRVHAVRALGGHELLAYEIDHVKGEVGFVLTTTSARSGRQIVLELSLTSDNGARRPQLTLDYLLDPDARTIPYTLAAPEVGGAITLAVNALRTSALDATQWQLHVVGEGVGSIQVEGFDLAGQRRFSAAAPGQTLTWHMMDVNGRHFANGVYLYVVTVRGVRGDVWRSEVRKLVLLR